MHLSPINVSKIKNLNISPQSPKGGEVSLRNSPRSIDRLNISSNKKDNTKLLSKHITLRSNNDNCKKKNNSGINFSLLNKNLQGKTFSNSFLLFKFKLSDECIALNKKTFSQGMLF